MISCGSQTENNLQPVDLYVFVKRSPLYGAIFIVDVKLDLTDIGYIALLHCV